jgi:hypothetical protein
VSKEWGQGARARYCEHHMSCLGATDGTGLGTKTSCSLCANYKEFVTIQDRADSDAASIADVHLVCNHTTAAIRLATQASVTELMHPASVRVLLSVCTHITQFLSATVFPLGTGQRAFVDSLLMLRSVLTLLNLVIPSVARWFLLLVWRRPACICHLPGACG